MKLCLTIAWAAGVLAVAGPAGAQTSDAWAVASLGLQYDVAGGGAARAEPFVYPIGAASSYGSWWFLDVRTPLVVGVIDAMAGAVEYAFDGDGDFSLPIWDGLNGDREHVRIPAFTLDARVKLVQSGRERVDLGLHGEMVGTFFQIDGVRRNAHFINAGPALGYGLFEPDGSGAVILAASVGNGFGHRASTNPFAEGSLLVWRRFASPLGAYARGQIGVQWIDYRPATTTAEDELDRIDAVAHGTFELGVLLEI